MKDKKKKREHEAMAQQQAEGEAKGKSRRPTLIAIVAGSLAVLMIAAALIIILVTLNDRYVNVYEDPHARIRLSNGMELNFVLWEQDEATTAGQTPKVSYAARNFIYLANLGYFNDALVYAAADAQAIGDGYARFGGFLNDGTHRGDDESDFWKKVDRMAPDGQDYGRNPFGYRLSKDSTSRVSKKENVGFLSFSYQRTATEFQITVSDVTAPTVGGNSWLFCPFGEAADQKTRDYILELSKLSTEAESRFNGHSYFKALLDDNDEIRIKSVRISKMLREFWKDFDFMTYHVSETGTKQNGLTSSWSYASQKKVGTV